jgi:hypothetical protein
MKVVIFGGEVFNLFKLGHKFKGAAQSKTPSMLFAYQMFGFAGLPGQEVSPMSANVAQTMNLFIMVFRKHQGLIQKTGKKCERKNRTVLFNIKNIGNKMPGFFKNRFFTFFKKIGRGIKICMKRLGFRNIFVNGLNEVHVWVLSKVKSDFINQEFDSENFQNFKLII